MSAQRKSIIFDADDTLAHFVAPVLAEVRRILKKDLHPHHMTDGAWLHRFLTPEELDAFLPHVFNTRFYNLLKPTAIVDQWDDHDRINLQQAFDFQVVTARGVALGRDALWTTSNWLNLHSLEMQGVTICHPDQPKSRVFPANAAAILDDSGKVILDAASHGLECFMVTQPWNAHMVSTPHAPFHRVTQENALQEMARILL